MRYSNGFSLAIVAVLAILLGACGQTAAQQPAATAGGMASATTEPAMTICALLPGRIDDMSNDQFLYESLMLIQDESDGAVSVRYTEGVEDIVDIEPALRDYAEQGCTLIIGYGFQFQDPIMAVSPEYPNLHFAIGRGAFMTSDNVVVFDMANDEVGYVFGSIAGGITKSNIVASIQGLEVPNTHMLNVSFEAGAKAINPDVETQIIYTGDFHDAGIAREATISAIDQGADVIFNSGDGMITGVLDAARSRGIYFMSKGDMSSTAPDVFVASILQHAEVVVREMVNDIESDTFGNKSYLMTFGNRGMTVEYKLEDVIAPIRSELDGVITGIESGEIQMPAVEQ